MYIRKYLAALWESWVSIMSGIASLILAFFVAFYYPTSDATTTRILLGISSAVCFIFSSYKIWVNEHKQNLNFENQIKELQEQNKPVLQLIQKQDEMILQRQELNSQMEFQKFESMKITDEYKAKIESLNSSIDWFQSQLEPRLKLSFDESMVEFAQYPHPEGRGTHHCRVIRVAVQNIGNSGVYGVKLTPKDFSWVGCSYDDFSFYAKNEFTQYPFTANNYSFTLNSGETKYLDIAYRKEPSFIESDFQRTILRLSTPNYVKKSIGDCEVLGLKILLTADGTISSELRLDIYYEKSKLINQDGKVSYFNILKCRESTLEPNAPTEIRRYEEKVTND